MCKVSELERASYLNKILLDSIPHPALLINKDRVVIAANELAMKAGALMGGYCWRDFGHCMYLSDEDREYYEANGIDGSRTLACSFCEADNALRNNKSCNKELRLACTDWDVYWIPTKEAGIYLHYAIDITERKKNECRLKESESRFKILAEASFEGVCIHVNGIILDCNTRLEAMFGYNNGELSGMPLSDILTNIPGKRPTEDIYWQIGPYRHNGIKKDGSMFEVEILTREIQYYGLNAQVLVIRDISDEASTRALMEALEADRLKTEFFSNVSHELRTPLNVVFSTVQLFEMYLQKGLINDSENRIGTGLVRMKQNCYRLMRLINNLIDVTKLSGGYIPLQLKNVDIVKIVKRICISAAEYVAGMNINFEFNTDVKEKIIACDSEKVEAIMLNLISNAIKFNKPDGIVTVNIHNEEDGVVISVEDTGRGIPEEKQGMLFQRFMQVDSSFTRDREGSGIGLFLVKSFVEMHKGQIWLKSEYGKGSKFEFKLPDRTTETKQANDLSTDSLHEENSNIIEKINIEFSDIYTE